MSNFLPGAKTYIVALGTVLLGVGAYFHGDMSATAALQVILNGLGLGALRLGVASK